MGNYQKFERGLDADPLKEVGKFLDTPVGRKIAHDEKLDVCIRNNYINVYNSGCCILKYEPNESGKGKFAIHKKYLYETCDSNNKYEALGEKDGDLVYGQNSFMNDVIVNPNKYFRRYLKTSEKENSSEKKYISEFLKKSVHRPFLIDLEVAYSQEKRADAKRGNAPRIDVACIDYIRNKLIFIEVKVDTDNRVRLSKAKNSIDSDGNAGIEVFRQIKGYKDFICEQSEGILKSYKKIADNYIKLDIVNKLSRLDKQESINVLDEFIKSGSIDVNPYLLLITTGHNETGPYGNNLDVIKNSFHEVSEVDFGNTSCPSYLFHIMK